MKVSFARERLASAFGHAAAVAPQRSPKAILQNVLLDASEATTLTATDLEIEIRLAVEDGEVQQAGRALLPVARFGAILRESLDDRLTITRDDRAVLVRGERSEFRFPAADPDEFPRVEADDDPETLELPARVFREMIRRTVFATDPTSPRFAFGGVLLEMEPERLTAVGTDSRRLAKIDAAAAPAAGGAFKKVEGTTIVPTRSMQLIERVLGDDDAPVRLAVRGNDFVLRTGELMLSSRLLEGRFPAWRAAIPRDRKSQSVELMVGPIYNALRQAAIVTSQESRRLDFSFAPGTLTLSARSAEYGQSRVELPMSYEGPALTISLNHRFVADFFRVLDSEDLFKLQFESPDAAALFSTGDGYEYVVMPLNPEGE